jgi:hypothetical protein
LLGIRRVDQFYLTTLATLFTVASGLGYVAAGIRQAREGGGFAHSDLQDAQRFSEQ